MFKRFWVLIITISCICLLLSGTTVWADTNVKILIYTGKIEIINNAGMATTYSMPQEIAEISADSIAKCIDGVAIFEVEDVKIMLEATESVKFSENTETGKVEVTCLNGEVQAIKGDEKVVLSKDQKLAWNLSNINILKQGSTAEVQILSQPRAKISSPYFVPQEEEPTELPHASPYQ